MLRELTMESLCDYDDGRVRVAWEMLVRQAIEDCLDRPGAGEARKVNLELQIKPILDEDGDCRDVQTEFSMGCKTPKMISRPIICQARKGGKAIWNDLSPDEPDQMTIDESL